MDGTISSTDAKRHFARLLRRVQDGNSYIVTRRGQPVARIFPIADAISTREQAKRDLLRKLRGQPLVNAGRWVRDDMYDD